MKRASNTIFMADQQLHTAQNFVTFDLPCDIRRHLPAGGHSCCLTARPDGAAAPSSCPCLVTEMFCRMCTRKRGRKAAAAPQSSSKASPSQPLWDCSQGNQMHWGAAQPPWETAQGPRNQSASAKWETHTRIYDGICWNRESAVAALKRGLCDSHKHQQAHNDLPTAASYQQHSSVTPDCPAL